MDFYLFKKLSFKEKAKLLDIYVKTFKFFKYWQTLFTFVFHHCMCQTNTVAIRRPLHNPLPACIVHFTTLFQRALGTFGAVVFKKFPKINNWEHLRTLVINKQ